MVEIKKNNSIQNTRINFEQGPSLESRNEKDRRKEPSKGFTYISSVGWIDRRERIRRKDDPSFF